MEVSNCCRNCVHWLQGYDNEEIGWCQAVIGAAKPPGFRGQSFPGTAGLETTAQSCCNKYSETEQKAS